MSIIDKLKVIAQELNDNIEYINQGGCGVVASIITETISSLVPTRIVALTHYDPKNIDEVRTDIHENGLMHSNDAWYRRGIDFGHVMVEVDVDGKTFMVDSRGVHENTDYDTRYGNKHHGYFTLDEMKRMANDPDHWNRRFKREQIPFIESIVKKQFQDMLDAKQDMLYNDLYQEQ